MLEVLKKNFGRRYFRPFLGTLIIWLKLINKGVKNFLSIPPLENDPPFNLIHLFLKEIFSPPINFIFQNIYQSLKKGKLLIYVLHLYICQPLINYMLIRSTFPESIRRKNITEHFWNIHWKTVFGESHFSEVLSFPSATFLK